MEIKNIAVVIIFTLILFIYELLQGGGIWEKLKFKGIFRSAFYALLIICLILFAGIGEDIVGGFMYEVF